METNIKIKNKTTETNQDINENNKEINAINNENSNIQKNKKIKTKVKYVRPKRDKTSVEQLDFALKLSRDYLIYSILYVLIIAMCIFLHFIGLMSPSPKTPFFVLIWIIVGFASSMLIICLINIIKREKNFKSYIYQKIFKRNLKIADVKSNYKFKLKKIDFARISTLVNELDRELTLKDINTELNITSNNTDISLTNIKCSPDTNYLLANCELDQKFDFELYANTKIKKAKLLKEINFENNSLKFACTNKFAFNNCISDEFFIKLTEILGLYQIDKLIIKDTHLLILIKDVEIFNLCPFEVNSKTEKIINEVTELVNFIKLCFEIIVILNNANLSKVKPKTTKTSKRKTNNQKTTKK